MFGFPACPHLLLTVNVRLFCWLACDYSNLVSTSSFHCIASFMLLLESVPIIAIHDVNYYLFRQLLCEDIHRTQRMGTYGAAKSGRHSDSQLFQWSDCACMGRSNKGMQGWASRTWACRRMYFLGSRKLILFHLWSNRIWGMWFVCHFMILLLISEP